MCHHSGRSYLLPYRLLKQHKQWHVSTMALQSCDSHVTAMCQSSLFVLPRGCLTFWGALFHGDACLLMQHSARRTSTARTADKWTGHQWFLTGTSARSTLIFGNIIVLHSFVRTSCRRRYRQHADHSDDHNDNNGIVFKEDDH